MWIKHPRSKKADTMLTFATAGLVFVFIATAVQIVLNRSITDLTGIVTAVLSVTIGAYATRKFTDAKWPTNGESGCGGCKKSEEEDV